MKPLLNRAFDGTGATFAEVIHDAMCPTRDGLDECTCVVRKIRLHFNEDAKSELESVAEFKLRRDARLAARVIDGIKRGDGKYNG